MTDINYMNDLKVEVEVPTAGLQNLIKNPDGEQGAWGWETPIGSTAMQKVTLNNLPVLQYSTSVSQAQYFQTEFMPATAGRYVVARLTIKAITTGHGLKMGINFYNSSKTYLSQSTLTAQTSSIGVKYVPAVQAPANTVYIKFFAYLHGNAGTNPNAGAFVQFDNAMVATSTTSTGFGSIRENMFTDPQANSGSSWEAYPGVPTSVSIVGTPTYNGSTALRLQNAYGQDTQVIGQSTADIAVTANSQYTVSAYIRSASGSRNWRIGMRYRINGTWSGIYTAGGAFGNSSTSWTRMSATLMAPTGADMARLVMYSDIALPGGEDHYFDGFMVEKTNVLGTYFDGNTAASGGVTYAWSGTPNASKSTATTASASFEYNPPYTWLPITGSVTSLNIDREAMNLGSMSVTLKNETLDPAGTNKTLTPGKQVRVQARDGAVWKNIFTGKINNAHVEYDKKKIVNSVVEGTITITGVDAMADLVNQGESRSVSIISELPYLLEGKGVPWNVNGTTSHYSGTPSIPVVNDNLSIADQVVLTRDTARGHAWVSKDGVLMVNNPDYAGSTRTSFYLSDVVANTVTNQFTDGDFETNDGDFWVPYGGTLTRSTLAARTGTYGLRVTANGTGIVPLWTSVVVPAGGLYKVGYSVRSSVANAQVKNTSAVSYNGYSTTWAFTSANTWYPLSGTALTAAYNINGVWWVDIDLELTTNGATPANGTTFDFDTFTIVQSANSASYSEIDVDWDTDRIMNQVELKHLRANVDGTAEEVPAGTYENTSSVDTYGPKKATFTIVGAPNFATYASNILSANATPVVRPNSVRVPIKDTADLAFAANVDLGDLIYIAFDEKVRSSYRVATLSHSIDASGWFIDIAFAAMSSNPAPQYTPAPPVDVANLTDTGWISAPLQGSWVNYANGYTLARYRRKDGIVYLQGLVASGGGVIFQLPAGFRSVAGTLIFGTNSAGATTRIDVDYLGNVTFMAGHNGYVSLAGIQFPADG